MAPPSNCWQVQMGNSSGGRWPPNQVPVGWGPPSPANKEETRDVGVSREVSPAPTLIMDRSGYQGENAETGVGSPASSDGEIDVVDDIIRAVTGETQKRGRGHPPTTNEHVGKREREEKEARVRREEEKERRAAEALSSTVPKGRRWTKLQEEEEKLEAEMACTPTEDIASRLVERSVRIFEIADCSRSMKGSLVKELQDAAALVRAATNVMAPRAREAREQGRY